MPETLLVSQRLDDLLEAMAANEPTDFDSLRPGDILSDDAAPTLNMWKILFDGC